MAGARDGLPVVVNARRYETDVEAITWRTIPPTRQGSDQGAGPGEQSLSMENIWRRTRDNWREGAGQDYADLLEEESSPLRFRTSDGIDPWTPRSLRMLPTVTNKRASANTNLKCISARVSGTDYLVIVDGSSVLYSSDPTAASPTFTAHTGTGAAVTDITTDGRRWWACDGSDVYLGTPGTPAAAVFSTQDADVIGYANGRLLIGHDNYLYELDSVGVATELFHHTDPGFVWTGFASSPAGIYSWGAVGDTSEVYVITAIDATGALDIPFVAAAWPQGERVNTMVSYAGVMVMATTRGVRMARIQGGGFLAYGPVIDEPGNVLCLEPQGEDIWFGWTYTAAINGLGRVHLSRTTDKDAIVPAFSTDLMARGTVSGNVLSVCTVVPRRYFAISGRGFYGESAATVLEPSGTIDLGWFTYGISEEKLLDTITVWCDGLPAGCTVVANIYADDATSPISTLTMDTTGQLKETQAYTGVINAERLRVVLTLTQVGAVSLVIRRITLRASPKAFVSQVLTLPLFVSDEVVSSTSQKIGQNPYQEFLFLEALLKARTRFTLNVGDWSASVRLEAVEVEKGGLGGGNGLDGWSDLREFVTGKWECTFITQEEAG